MRLGEFFTFEELTNTSTGIPNHPDDAALVNLVRLVCLLLDPIRKQTGLIRVTSGFRSDSVNKAVNGAAGSFHRYGLASDIKPGGTMTARGLFEAIRSMDLPHVDKCILEFDSWVHIQTQAAGFENRNQYMIAEKVNGKTTYRNA